MAKSFVSKGVGKSNLMSQFFKKYSNLASEPTTGIDFVSRSIHIDGNHIRCQMWDASGQERFRPLLGSYYKGIVGALIVYDITKKVTFDNVKRWLKELREITDETVVVMLIGNKTDLDHLRAVTTAEAKAFAESENILFTETSAFDGFVVKKTFYEFNAQILVKTQKERDMAKDHASIPKEQTINVESKDDHEPFEEEHANTNSTSNNKSSYGPCPDQELANLKEKLEVVHKQNVEVLARVTAHDTELALLRTSVDLLRSNMEKLLAQHEPRMV
ncbi:hypothetical protein QVD17_17991 [Tagetes erecta]|uniref:Uncharacterized protein n=1 Tax=Tagetes erecta TaxID=13708 RepID=A0AAD8KGY1_TARER|nr:hypothetical protein QVD17_17991 [Tagetes erecta]